jgi:hypothetical protein
MFDHREALHTEGGHKQLSGVQEQEVGSLPP